MNKVDYIEEKGQTLNQCMLEIRYMEMVEPKHFLTNKFGLVVLHDKDELIKIPSRNYYFRDSVRYSFHYFKN